MSSFALPTRHRGSSRSRQRVASASLASIAWLTNRPRQSGSGRRSPSLLQKLYQSWVELGRPDTGLELITGRPIDGSDRVLALIDRRNSIGTGLRRASTPTLATARADLADHLECDEKELCDFLDGLAIRVGQTEAEWVSRVIDVAAGAGIRADNAAVGTATCVDPSLGEGHPGSTHSDRDRRCR